MIDSRIMSVIYTEKYTLQYNILPFSPQFMSTYIQGHPTILQEVG